MPPHSTSPSLSHRHPLLSTPPLLPQPPDTTLAHTFLRQQQYYIMIHSYEYKSVCSLPIQTNCEYMKGYTWFTGHLMRRGSVKLEHLPPVCVVPAHYCSEAQPTFHAKRSSPSCFYSHSLGLTRKFVKRSFPFWALCSYNTMTKLSLSKGSGKYNDLNNPARGSLGGDVQVLISFPPNRSPGRSYADQRSLYSCLFSCFWQWFGVNKWKTGVFWS